MCKGSVLFYAKLSEHGSLRFRRIEKAAYLIQSITPKMPFPAKKILAPLRAFCKV
jgi:hypothetical protein